MADWAEFPGPQWYRPEEIEPALEQLAEVSTEIEASAAYNKVLFAVGNNHRGTIYPCAVAAAPRILDIALNSKGVARVTAFDVLADLCLFEAEHGFERFTLADGGSVDTKQAVLAAARRGRQSFLDALSNESEMPGVRVIVIDLLQQLEGDLGEVAAVLRALPERSGRGTFDTRRREFLVEHGYL